MSNRSLLLDALELMTDRWKGYRERARMRSELALLLPAEIDALAADCGLTPVQFLEVINQVHHAADELGCLLTALGIDAESLRKRDYNDMRRVCVECQWKAVCRRSIKKGTIAIDHVAFCNNSDVLAEIQGNSGAVATSH
ncbi:hypothetical protein IB238_20800 [Rhizobium sp. ARZ01]|uniref:DUF6455 family protein n=1 Tax=Rhizobium sp. ARZ01 TaxID=2769313 RepID=UPI0017826EA3|nr:DUF6455 family protein [Rhizobium sp. ARZ01]MBD9375067.1 hypothetical protein [Rhizobium sp. ARZ01]